MEISQEAEQSPAVTVTVAVPLARAVICPEESTVSRSGRSLSQ